MPEKTTFSSRLKHAWNAFLNRDPPHAMDYSNIGPSFGSRPDRPQMHMSS